VVDEQVRPAAPVDLRAAVQALAAAADRAEARVLYDGEFSATLLRGAAPAATSAWVTAPSEVFVYVLQGAVTVALQAAAEPPTAFRLIAEDVFLVPAGLGHRLQARTRTGPYRPRGTHRH
jgi:quercetin dioxygenase-like cupin family protein